MSDHTQDGPIGAWYAVSTCTNDWTISSALYSIYKYKLMSDHTQGGP